MPVIIDHRFPDISTFVVCTFKNVIDQSLYDILNTHKPMLRVMGEDKPAAVVKSRLLKLNRCDIDYAIDQYQKQVTKVHNHKAVLSRML